MQSNFENEKGLSAIGMMWLISNECFYTYGAMLVNGLNIIIVPSLAATAIRQFL